MHPHAHLLGGGGGAVLRVEAGVDDSVHVQVQAVVLHAVWVGLARVHRHLHTVDDLRGRAGQGSTTCSVSDGPGSLVCEPPAQVCARQQWQPSHALQGQAQRPVPAACLPPPSHSHRSCPLSSAPARHPPPHPSQSWDTCGQKWRGQDRLGTPPPTGQVADTLPCHTATCTQCVVQHRPGSPAVRLTGWPAIGRMRGPAASEREQQASAMQRTVGGSGSGGTCTTAFWGLPWTRPHTHPALPPFLKPPRSRAGAFSSWRASGKRWATPGLHTALFDVFHKLP